MPKEPIETMAISEFKATCLAVLERVRRTGRPLLVTRRGEPIAEIVPAATPVENASWLGSMRDTARINGDIVAPASSTDEWEVLSE